MNKKIIYGALFLILSLFVIGATVTETGYLGNFIQDKFNTSNSIENITFTGTNNETLYISLPKYSNVTYAQLNLTPDTNLSNFTILLDENVLYNSSIETYDLEKGLISYFTFDSNANDDYGSNDGTVTGALHNTTVYKMGTGSYTFDGTEDYITFANEEAFDWDKEDNFTFGMWLKMRGTADRGLLSKGTGAKGIKISTNGEERYQWYLISSGGNFDGRRDNTADGTNNDNTWHYFTFIYNSTSQSFIIYRDGSRFDDTDYAGGTLASILNNEPLLLGKDDQLTNEYEGEIDEFAIWNKSLNETEHDLIYNSGNGYRDFYQPTGWLDTSTLVNLSLNTLNNYLTSCTADNNGYCQVPLTFLTDSVGNLTANIGNSINYSLQYNFTYNDETIEKVTNTYTLEVFTNETVNSSFTYNNTLYTPSKTEEATKNTFTSSISGDWVNNNSLNQTFSLFWNITVLNNNYSTYIYNQTVHKIFIDNCTNTTTITLNFSIKDEETGSDLIGDLEATFNVWFSSSVFSRDYPFQFSGNNTYDICINPNFANYTTTTTIEYSKSGYGTRNYYLNNLLINNQTQEILLYLLNDSSSPTSVTFYIYDQDGYPLSNYYLEIERQDLGTNTYSLINTLQTDTDGVVVADLILNTVFYRFTVENPSNEVVFTTSERKIFTSPVYFYVPTQQVENITSLIVEDVSSYLIYDNSTQEFRFYFNDQNNVVNQGCLEVVQLLPSGEVQLDYSCISASTGTIEYFLSNNSSGQYEARGTVKLQEQTHLLKVLGKEFGGFYKQLGQTGTILSLIIVGVLGFMGLFSPVITVVLTIVGLIAAFLLGQLFLTKALLILIVILGGIIIFKSKK